MAANKSVSRSTSSFNTLFADNDPDYVTFGHFEGQPSATPEAELASLALSFDVSFVVTPRGCHFIAPLWLTIACPGLAGEVLTEAMNAGLLEVKTLGLVAA